MELDARGDAGSAGIAGFAAAVAIFAIAFYGFLSFVESPAGVEKIGPQLRSKAEGGLWEVLNSPGSSSDPQKAWHELPDSITRFGLVQDGTPGYLDLAKLRNLTRGGFHLDSANGLLDYEEARAALGLGDYDFHLRSYPILSTLDEGELRPVKGLAVAYVGDFSSVSVQSDDYPVWNSTSVQDKGNHVFVNVTIKNNGTVSSMFKVEFDVPVAGTTIEDDQFTRILAPNEIEVVPLKLYKDSAWAWGSEGAKVKVVVKDPTKTVGRFDIGMGSVNMATTDYAGAWVGVTVTPEKWSYKTSQFPKVGVQVVEADGDTENRPTVNITVRWSSNGTIADQWQGRLPAGNQHQLCCKLPAGTYNVTVYRPSDAAFNATEILVVTDGSEGYFSSQGQTVIVESDASQYERGLLEALVDGWTNLTYEEGGDVYQDLTTVMNNDFADNLTALAYDAVVVGSNADQNAMTDAAAKEAVKEFVRRGGLLVVLGSVDQDVGWLQPLFASSLTTSGEGVGAPDPTNPILHVPEVLAWRGYADNANTWIYQSDADASHFTHVVVRDGASQEDIVALSKPGHFGNGTIVLTGWTLHALTQPQNDLEARKVLYNFLMQAMGTLFLDFGPSIPGHAEVASSSRMATAPHPYLEGEEVLVRLVLYVFR